MLVAGGIGVTPLLSIYSQLAADFHERERQKRTRGGGGGHGEYSSNGRTGANIDEVDEPSSLSSLSSSSTGGLKTVVFIWVVRELALFELFAADVS